MRICFVFSLVESRKTINFCRKHAIHGLVTHPLQTGEFPCQISVFQYLTLDPPKKMLDCSRRISIRLNKRKKKTEFSSSNFFLQSHSHLMRNLRVTGWDGTRSHTVHRDEPTHACVCICMCERLPDKQAALWKILCAEPATGTGRPAALGGRAGTDGGIGVRWLNDSIRATMNVVVTPGEAKKITLFCELSLTVSTPVELSSSCRAFLQSKSNFFVVKL